MKPASIREISHPCLNQVTHAQRNRHLSKAYLFTVKSSLITVASLTNRGVPHEPTDRSNNRIVTRSKQLFMATLSVYDSLNVRLRVIDQIQTCVTHI